MIRSWPVVPGAYAIGDPNAPVAICTLTDDALFSAVASLPGVAIAGRLNTANLGIEDLLVNVTANPNIRFLLVCGKESPVFQPGQTLAALAANGLTPERRIAGAAGHEPFLRNIATARVARFRRQVELVDRAGETAPGAIARAASVLAARSPGPFAEPVDTGEDQQVAAFAWLAPGGRREALWYDPKGFFVIGLDRQEGQIVVRHYERDYTPAHEMRSHSAESIVLGLLREDLVSQLSHAGYLGAELAKAEAALRLGLRYEQDRPLRAGA
jgi:tetrahydromethanopterin S-methyltransferase subunit A